MKKIISFQLDLNLLKQLLQEAEDKEMSLSGYIRLILKNRKK